MVPALVRCQRTPTLRHSLQPPPSLRLHQKTMHPWLCCHRRCIYSLITLHSDLLDPSVTTVATEDTSQFRRRCQQDEQRGCALEERVRPTTSCQRMPYRSSFRCSPSSYSVDMPGKSHHRSPSPHHRCVASTKCLPILECPLGKLPDEVLGGETASTRQPTISPEQPLNLLVVLVEGVRVEALVDTGTAILIILRRLCCCL